MPNLIELHHQMEITRTSLISLIGDATALLRIINEVLDTDSTDMIRRYRLIHEGKIGDNYELLKDGITLMSQLKRLEQFADLLNTKAPFIGDKCRQFR